MIVVKEGTNYPVEPPVSSIPSDKLKGCLS